MKTLIVGSRGFLGGHLRRRLKRRDDLEVAEASSSDGSFNVATGLLNPVFAIPPETQCIVYLSHPLSTGKCRRWPITC